MGMYKSSTIVGRFMIDSLSEEMFAKETTSWERYDFLKE